MHFDFFFTLKFSRPPTFSSSSHVVLLIISLQLLLHEQLNFMEEVNILTETVVEMLGI